ncbi:efflux RND transporter periplasmic adaptor subunit [Bradyrhizobium sp. U87765 SZCCT0131]|uniref:efflux RND transporter periplasmic adaptor subunit n=1 Tax=unclassified Bradyrhizobium TaxID=2631580 RepID=UPI001BA97C0D|nr:MULTISPECIES: efflux RND transporter periplasmic adaptor subunit [unclassified Bradyrhizobium]MBR1218911.1 efflux RND transporter periplasmic adaptor subunit [Bradyrhizobium sp. U87765 SZCCT0131]MBR1261562.1 efflux RND transporter periplasmic adaptor subunit [Bradyrhizobium sp. U87765 SZCCT0134]MBR1306585.1 efflux RND transporter periplasmic adaptor subunit [Bradyrhizobium sp. U87765 SZCCT0110]MBR1317344.1 efflux RND transporter periplasmic adaptor subunit [Bradyrhizobium sp. U87765 SZCCT010
MVSFRTRSALQAGCLLAVSAALGGCDDHKVAAKPPTLVRAEVVALKERVESVTLTGDVRARVQAELSFRVSGRVTERLVDVGAHVESGQVLARLDPTEQKADLDAATAAVTAAESQVRVANATFDRQKTLLSNGFTTRAAYDQAQEGLRTAEGSLESARAQLGTARDALGYTELRASAAGVITARSIEIGQVAEATQPAFSLAQDGERDAVFEVYESIFFKQSPGDDGVVLALVSSPSVTARGRVREVSPTIDPKTGTVRVKVAIMQPPAAMTLGSPVTGTATARPERRIILPWGALTAVGSAPAVWVIDDKSRAVALKPITVEEYGTGTIVVKSGLDPGERVVTDGGKLLSPGQVVTFEGARAS